MPFLKAAAPCTKPALVSLNRGRKCTSTPEGISGILADFFVPTENGPILIGGRLLFPPPFIVDCEPGGEEGALGLGDCPLFIAGSGGGGGGGTGRPPVPPPLFI